MIRAFVIGHPVAHSRSPLIHGHWLREHGIAGSYERVDVRPEELPAFLSGCRARGFSGGNVTAPHKEAAFRLLRDVSPEARRLGAVNTLVLDGEDLRGHNTDGAGFAASLDEAVGPGWAAGPGEAVVIGAGGAARAVVAALLDRGVARVVVANRTRARADEVRTLDPARIDVEAPEVLPERLRGAGLVVNATTLGMAGQPPLALPLANLPADAIVADIVYVPRRTPLLADAEARGLRTVGGLGMLLHQAVPGFEAWFGIRPSVTPALRALVEADIAGRAR